MISNQTKKNVRAYSMYAGTFERELSESHTNNENQKEMKNYDDGRKKVINTNFIPYVSTLTCK